MKKLSVTGISISCLLQTTILFAQTPPLNQHLPANLQIKNVLNTENETLAFSTITNKIIILDFWNTSCTSCIYAFPKLDSLQKKYDSSMQVILVTQQTKDSIVRFFQKRKKIKMPSLPMITGDSLLSGLFPPDGYPYVIWIDKKQTARYISYGASFTAKNVQDFINTGNVQADIEIKKLRFGSLFMLSDSDAAKKLKYYSHISGCIDTLYIGNAQKMADDDNHTLHVSANCSSIVELVKTAFAEFYKYNFSGANSIILEVTDKTKYQKPVDPEEYSNWYLYNSYNYELCVPQRMGDQLYKIMQEDLTRFFNLKAFVTRRPVKSYVLIRTSTKDKLKTKGGPATDRFHFSSIRYPSVDSIRSMTNTPFEQVSKVILAQVSFYSSMPCYDKTGIKENVDMYIPAIAIDPVDMNLLQKELKKYDLALVEKYILKEVLVIKENDPAE